MAKVIDRPSPYEQDFYAWTQTQAALLRDEAARRTSTALDLENLAEEIESLGNSDRRALTSHLSRIVEHLLKLQHSPALEPRRGWRVSIAHHRTDVEAILQGSPSLRRIAREEVEACYQTGRRLATIGLEGEVTPERLPARCPYTLEVLLDPDWWPEAEAESGSG